MTVGFSKRAPVKLFATLSRTPSSGSARAVSSAESTESSVGTAWKLAPALRTSGLGSRGRAGGHRARAGPGVNRFQRVHDRHPNGSVGLTAQCGGQRRHRGIADGTQCLQGFRCREPYLGLGVFDKGGQRGHRCRRGPAQSTERRSAGGPDGMDRAFRLSTLEIDLIAPSAAALTDASSAWSATLRKAGSARPASGPSMLRIVNVPLRTLISSVWVALASDGTAFATPHETTDRSRDP